MNWKIIEESRDQKAEGHPKNAKMAQWGKAKISGEWHKMAWIDWSIDHPLRLFRVRYAASPHTRTTVEGEGTRIITWCQRIIIGCL